MPPSHTLLINHHVKNHLKTACIFPLSHAFFLTCNLEGSTVTPCCLHFMQECGPTTSQPPSLGVSLRILFSHASLRKQRASLICNGSTQHIKLMEVLGKGTLRFHTLTQFYLEVKYLFNKHMHIINILFISLLVVYSCCTISNDQTIIPISVHCFAQNTLLYLMVPNMYIFCC